MIAILAGITTEAIWVMTAFAWRFPVPLREFLGVIPWSAFIVVYNVVLARRTFVEKLGKVRQYLPIVGTQLVLFYAFLGLSLGFAYVPASVQILTILVFPLIKVGLKRFLWKYSQKLGDVSTDVTICMVEISGSLYQTMCMQFVNSAFLGSLIMAMDFAQTAVEVRAYLQHDYMSDGRSTLETAVKIVKNASLVGQQENSRTLDAKRKRPERLSLHDTHESQGASQPVVRTKKSSWWRHLLPQMLSRSEEYSVLAQKSSFDFTMVQSSSAHSVVLERSMIQTHSSPRPPDTQSDQRIVSEGDRCIGANGKQESLKPPSSENASVKPDVALAGQQNLVSHDTPSSNKAPAVKVASTEKRKPASKRRSSVGRVFIDGVSIPRKDQARILEQTLQLLFACEVLIFVEYMEIFIPLLYGSCIGSLWHLPNAKYNLILMIMTRNGMLTEVAMSFAYAAFESLSFVSMYWFMKKYGISVLYLLAFVLETYWTTLQGKLIGCFVTILNSATIHQGVDFSFEFDYHKMLQGSATPS